jgi:hypothetical protein
MKKFLSVIPLVLVVAAAAYGQVQGQYRGRTSQNMDIQFSVVIEGDQLCVNPITFSVTLTCPSGARTGWGAFYGICSPIVDSSFTVSLDPLDGAIPTYGIPGVFDSETTAQGSIGFKASHLRFPGKVDPVEAQLCDSGDVSWTAQRVSGAADRLNFESNFVVKSTDKNGNTVTFYKLDSN